MKCSADKTNSYNGIFSLTITTTDSRLMTRLIDWLNRQKCEKNSTVIHDGFHLESQRDAWRAACRRLYEAANIDDKVKRHEIIGLIAEAESLDATFQVTSPI